MAEEGGGGVGVVVGRGDGCDGGRVEGGRVKFWEGRESDIGGRCKWCAGGSGGKEVDGEDTAVCESDGDVTMKGDG